MISFLISIAWPLFLLLIGWGIGRIKIRNHQKRLDEQEDALKAIRLHNVKYKPDYAAEKNAKAVLVTGSLVLSIDVFRRVIAGFIQLAGGEVNNYTDLLDRGRRDALLRLKAKAHALGADDIYNIKIQSASIGMGKGIEILAYGTAVKSL